MKISPIEIDKYLNSGKYDFKRFKMHYTPKEILSINSFNLNKSKTFDHYGSYETLNIKEFLTEIGDNNKTQVTNLEKIISNIIKRVLKGYKMKHFWLGIRASMPNNDFDIPRWHKDGRYFPKDENEKKTTKFLTVLKGPGTLLIKSTKKINEIYNKNFEKEKSETSPSSTLEELFKAQDKYRPILAKELSKHPDGKVIQLKNSEGLVFHTGVNMDEGTLHSEPPIDKPRLFMSIIPSTEENINAFHERQKKFDKKFKK